MEKHDTRTKTIIPIQDDPEGFFRDIEVEFLIHELKDPLSVIETGLRTVLEKQEKFGSISERQERTLKRSLRNTKKARSMLNNLLEIGRSEAGCFICYRFDPVKSTYTALKDALETVTGPISEEISNYEDEKQAADLLGRHGIFVEIEPRLEKLEMFQDEIKFQQIAGNLFKNAMHHRKKRLDIKLGVENDFFSVAVSDDGPGIDPEHHELIFKRYKQVKECSITPRKGHGLGLAGAHILARCLGGDIELTSQIGQGATFRFFLPMSMAQND